MSQLKGGGEAVGRWRTPVHQETTDIEHLSAFPKLHLGKYNVFILAQPYSTQE